MHLRRILLWPKAAIQLHPKHQRNAALLNRRFGLSQAVQRVVVSDSQTGQAQILCLPHNLRWAENTV